MRANLGEASARRKGGGTLDLGLRDLGVVVTGASSGLGLAAARALAREGARLAIVARRPGPLSEVASILRHDGALQVAEVAADLDRDDDRDRWWGQVEDQVGTLSAAIVNTGNPVGGFFPDPRHPAHADGFAKMRAAMDIGRRAAEAMAGRGGTVAFILSRTAVEPEPDLLVSSWVRAGLLAFAKAAAVRWGPSGVRVVSVLPSLTRTPPVEATLAERAQKAGRDVPAQAAHEAASVPLRRLGDVDSFGRLMAFLVSPACDYVTGSAIRFDGGSVKAP